MTLVELRLSPKSHGHQFLNRIRTRAQSASANRLTESSRHEIKRMATPAGCSPRRSRRLYERLRLCDSEQFAVASPPPSSRRSPLRNLSTQRWLAGSIIG